jgi:very-short-patch-repair endonuclease
MLPQAAFMLPKWKIGIRANELRARMTPGEAAMRTILARFHKFGVWFQSSAPIHGYIADFYCAAPHRQVSVEVDGGYHNTPEQRAKDAKRTARLNAHGIIVLRFTNERAIHTPEQVFDEIRASLERQRPLREVQLS